MYLIYTVILLVLILVLIITLAEEIMTRRGITHGIANKYWVLREKRKFVRFQEGMKIRYNRIDSAHSQDNAKMRNISRKGLCISTYEKLKEKDNLEIEIEVPGFSKPIKLTGCVMWVKELRSPDDHGRRMFYTGMRFGKITPEAEAILITHLNILKRP
jgi:PilZ domain